MKKNKKALSNRSLPAGSKMGGKNGVLIGRKERRAMVASYKKCK